MEYLFSSVLGYLFGSIPFAFLVMKKYKGIDISNTGSGNIGAMNSYEVSNSKFLGILIFILDALKGIIPILILMLIYPGNFIFPALALIFAVFGHCYSPWLSFKGGRGLATAAGGSAILFPFLLIVWGILWAIVFFMKKDILFANIWATIMSLVISFMSAKIVIKYSTPQPDSISSLILFSTGVLLIIFIKHIDPLKEILESKRVFKKENSNE